MDLKGIALMEDIKGRKFYGSCCLSRLYSGSYSNPTVEWDSSLLFRKIPIVLVCKEKMNQLISGLNHL